MAKSGKNPNQFLNDYHVNKSTKKTYEIQYKNMGFDDSKFVEVPDWSMNLRHLYWMIRVQGRIEKTRRKYYRMVEKEKLRLAEMGINQAQILAVCRYYSNFRNHHKLRELLQENHPQMVFIFSAN